MPAYTLYDSTPDDIGSYTTGDAVALTATPDITSDETLTPVVSPSSAVASQPSPITWAGNTTPIAVNFTIKADYDVDAEGNGPTVTCRLRRGASEYIATYTATVSEPVTPSAVTGLIFLGS